MGFGKTIWYWAFFRKLKRSLIAFHLSCAFAAFAAGTWTPLIRQAPTGINTMLLLSDGTVIGADGGNHWYRLAPDASGSYINGTWSTIAPMNDTRLYYSSAVLTNGRVFIAGGEYGTGTSSAEVYDPVLDMWQFCPGSGEIFSDSASMMLPNGDVLVSPVWPTNYGGTIIYTPASNSWRRTSTLVRGFFEDEASWVRLPDDSVLTDDPYGLTATNCERFIPSLNTWINDASVPVSLYDAGDEMGAATLLPNGKAFFIGGGGHTALYTPSGNTNPGTCVAGPDVPNGMTAPDAPAAMMANGHVLCAVIGTNGPPTAFVEYDPVANAFASVSGPGSFTNSLSPYYTRMLDLPDGSVLYSVSSSQLYVYKPSGAPLAAGMPTILGIKTNFYRSYHLTGKLLSGISQGASYGDDAQMDSNYPLVRLTNNTSGNVYYARAYNWTSTSVMASNATNSTEFIVPANFPTGNYSLVVVANGIASAPTAFSFTQDALQVSGLNGFVSAGPTNGPFTPSSTVYTLVNQGVSSVNWTAVNASSWLSVSPTNGTLSSGAATNIVVSVRPDATNLAIGIYSTNVIISNATSTAIQNIPCSLQVNPLVLNGGFETGSSAFWYATGDLGNSGIGNVGDYSTVNNYSERLFIHSGDHGAILGQNTSLGYIYQTVPTTAGKTYLLSFWFDNPVSSVANEFLVYWDGTVLLDKASIGITSFTNMQFIVSASGSSTTLEFGFHTATNFFGLDDITLTEIPSARITSLVHNSSGGVTLNFVSASGMSSRLLWTPNLNPPIVWTPIFTNPAGGPWQFTDNSAQGFGMRFYEISTP